MVHPPYPPAVHGTAQVLPAASSPAAAPKRPLLAVNGLHGPAAPANRATFPATDLGSTYAAPAAAAPMLPFRGAPTQSLHSDPGAAAEHWAPARGNRRLAGCHPYEPSLTFRGEVPRLEGAHVRPPGLLGALPRHPGAVVGARHVLAVLAFGLRAAGWLVLGHAAHHAREFAAAASWSSFSGSWTCPRTPCRCLVAAHAAVANALRPHRRWITVSAWATASVPFALAPGPVLRDGVLLPLAAGKSGGPGRGPPALRLDRRGSWRCPLARASQHSSPISKCLSRCDRAWGPPAAHAALHVGLVFPSCRPSAAVAAQFPAGENARPPLRSALVRRAAAVAALFPAGEHAQRLPRS